MKNQYRIGIGIRRGAGRITLNEKIEMEEKLMKDLLLMISSCKSTTIMQAIKILNLTKDDVVESIEIRED